VTNNATVAAIKTKNPVTAETTHIFSNATMILLPAIHGSKNNGSSWLKLLSVSRHGGRILVLAELAD
jgi:hypothetical protein